jgi:hypothetical protein
MWELILRKGSGRLTDSQADSFRGSVKTFVYFQ